MMFTDLDEVMYVMHPQYGNSIPAVLRHYEHAGAVLVHRRDVGSGGVAERTPDQGLLATFTKCTGHISEHVSACRSWSVADLLSRSAPGFWVRVGCADTGLVLLGIK